MRNLEFHIPILGVRDVENYSGSFLDTFASYCDCSLPLNRPLRPLSVLDFFDKIASLVLEMGRSIHVLGIRVIMYIYV